MATTDTFIVSFPAEIKQVSSKKLASLDKEYRVILDTQDGAAFLLDQFAADVMVKVTVEIAE